MSIPGIDSMLFVHRQASYLQLLRTSQNGIFFSYSGGSRISQRGRQPLRGGNNLIFDQFFPELHENEEVLVHHSCPVGLALCQAVFWVIWRVLSRALNQFKKKNCQIDLCNMIPQNINFVRVDSHLMFASAFEDSHLFHANADVTRKLS